MQPCRVTSIRRTRVCLAVLAALAATKNVQAITGSETLIISTDTTVSSFIVEDPATPDFVSMATLGFDYTGTPITLHANSFSTYLDRIPLIDQWSHTGPRLDPYTTMGWGVNRTYYTSVRSESNLLNIDVNPALLGSSTGVRFTADTINGVDTSSLSAGYIIDQTIVNGGEFATYDNDAGDGRFGIVSATTANALTGSTSADNIFLTSSEAIASPLTVNSLALDQGVAATLGGGLDIQTGRILFSSNSAINGNVNAGGRSTVYVTGANNQLNGQINTGAGSLTIDGGDGTVAELTIGAQQTASSVHLAEINLNLTANNIFQGADVYLMSHTGWTGYDSDPAQGSLDIGSTYQNVNSMVASEYGALNLYGNGTLHAQERIAFASPGIATAVNANLISENDMNLLYADFFGELRARNLTIYGGNVFGDIADGTGVTNATFDVTRLHGAKSYSGSTTIGKGWWTNNYPTFTQFGTASTSSAFILEGDAALTNSLDMTVYRSVAVVQDDVSGIVNRLNDNMAVALEDTGRLALDGRNFSGDAYERIGNVSTANGYGKLEALGGANGTATLSVGNIQTGNNLLMVDTDAGGHVLADSINGDASDRLLKSVFVKAGEYTRLLGCDIGCDYADLDLPGFAEYAGGEIVAAQVDNVDINVATSSQLVHIDSSAEGVLTADRSVRGMILGGADGSISHLSGPGDLTVGEGGILFWQNGAAAISNDVHLSGGVLRTYHEDQNAYFDGVLTGALNVAGPGSVVLNNSNNDFSSLVLQGGALHNFNSSRNDIDIHVVDGSRLNNATLGSAGPFTGTLAIDGVASIAIAGDFNGQLLNTGTVTVSADRVSGFVQTTGAYSDNAYIRANDISGLTAEANGGRVIVSNGGGGLVTDGGGSSVDLRTSGQGSVVFESALTIGNSDTLLISNLGSEVEFRSSLTNNGAIVVSDNYNSSNQHVGIDWALANNGSATVVGRIAGSIANAASGSLSIDGTNAGVIDNTAGGTLDITHLVNESQVLSNEITTSGVVENNSNGTIDVTGAYTQNGGDFLNRGQVTADSVVINDGSVSIASNADEPDGALHVTNDLVQNGGSLAVDGDLYATRIELNGGTAILTGSGTIHADVINGGQFNPGNSPGTLDIDGDYSQEAGGVLLIEIGGLTAGTEYDVVNVTGNAYLGGTLDVDLYDLGSGLFSPSLNDSFDILAAESISGDFDALLLASLGAGLDWDLNLLTDVFGTTDVLRLSVIEGTSPVPVPAAVWLFGSGLVGLIGVARRKKTA